MIRSFIWKLADQTQVFADFRGFCEMALPGEAPAGLLRWISRWVMASGITEWWWVSYLVLGLALGGVGYAGLGRYWTKRSWWARGLFIAGCWLSGEALLLLPILFSANYLWRCDESAFPIMNALGLLAAAGIYRVLRRLVERPWGLVPAVVIAAFGCVPFGVYALLGALALAGRGLWKRRGGGWGGLAGLGGLAAAILAVALPLSCRFVYGDLALRHGWRAAHALPPRLAWPNSDIARQLEVERRIAVADWRGARETAARGEAFPLRMEIAYRLLASFRSECLLAELFAYPMRTSPRDTDADQSLMDGYVLLFEYGLLLPARKALMEKASSEGWRPQYFRYLGDIAFLLGERERAYRGYSQLMRCPWRGKLAKGRLRLLAGEEKTLPDGLGTVAELAAQWRRIFADNAWLTFFPPDTRVEQLIYDLARHIRAAPRSLVELYLATLLLDGDAAALVREKDTLEALYPAPAPWPRAVQEAVLTEMMRLKGEERRRYAEIVRSGAIESPVAARCAAFRDARAALERQDTPQARLSLLRRFGDTYQFYEYWALGK